MNCVRSPCVIFTPESNPLSPSCPHFCDSPSEKSSQIRLKDTTKQRFGLSGSSQPKQSMYGISTCIYHKNKANGGVVNIFNIPYMDGMGLINLLKRHFQGSLNHGWISIMKTKDAPSQVRSRNGVSGLLGFEGLPGYHLPLRSYVFFFGVVQGFFKELKRW